MTRWAVVSACATSASAARRNGAGACGGGELADRMGLAMAVSVVGSRVGA